MAEWAFLAGGGRRIVELLLAIMDLQSRLVPLGSPLPLWLPFGSPLAHVWVLLAPFWHPSARFGSLLLTFGALWLPLGSLLPPFGSLLLLLVSLLAPSPNTFSQDSLRRLRGGISRQSPPYCWVNPSSVRLVIASSLMTTLPEPSFSDAILKYFRHK